MTVYEQCPDAPFTPGMRERVGFLSQPANYPSPAHSVSVVETHHAWVFLTDEHAYKMKKPSRHGRLDLSSVAARRHLCEEELRLNRRLARRTYLGLAALVVDSDGALSLGTDGRAVDWLIRMRRLPDGWFLDEAARNNRVSRRDIHRVLRTLLRFYDTAPVCTVGGLEYSARLAREIDQLHEELAPAVFSIPENVIDDVVGRLDRYVAVHHDDLEQRQHDGRVRDLHGDLRPEHICLLPDGEPEIIDSVEFNADLRCLDCVEELAYLGLECRVIGQPWIERLLIDSYAAIDCDDSPTHLWRFYAARRAGTRAMLCAWHTLDGGAADHWLARARRYLSFARQYLE